MRKIGEQELFKIIGGGCRRYLRRAHRGLEQENYVRFYANVILYNECMD